MPVLIILGFVCFIGIAIAAIVYSIKAARQRREALQQLADLLQFSFDPADYRGVPNGLGAFSAFSVGDDRRAYNTVGGTASAWGKPLEVSMGDYRYTTETGSGEDRKRETHRISYLHARLPFNVIARMRVRHENFLDKIAGAVGFEDINFESAEFSRKFHISGSDKKLVYDLFDPRMIEWFMANDPSSMEIAGVDLLITDGRTWKPEQFKTRYDWLTAFLEKWPTHLVERLGSAV